MNISKKSKLSRCEAADRTPRVLSDKNFNSASDPKGAPLTLSWRCPGSVSVEAALVLPIFMVCILGLFSVLNYLRVYGSVLSQLKEIGEPISVYGCALELTQEEAAQTEDMDILKYLAQSLLFSEGYLASVFQLQWEDLVGEETIVDGAGGVSFLGSVLDTEEGELYIQAHYQVRALLPLAVLQSDLSNYYYSRLWTGYEEKTTSEEMVYVTADSEVYHLTDSCSYLRVTVKTVTAMQLGSARNNSGASYRSCSLCGGTAIAGIYYITNEGDCYHTSSTCSGLKRTVYQIPLSQAEDKRPCSRCGKEE